jgi:hypothetical protein
MIKSGIVCGGSRNPGGARMCGDRRVAGDAQELAEGFCDGRVVVDDQDLGDARSGRFVEAGL